MKDLTDTQVGSFDFDLLFAGGVLQGVAAQADEPTAERDPRRNGMDNPFGDGNPMHPSLALLTGVSLKAPHLLISFLMLHPLQSKCMMVSYRPSDPQYDLKSVQHGHVMAHAEIAVQQLLRETSTHVQAQLSRVLRSATISQNIVNLHGPSEQDRLFSEVRTYSQSVTHPCYRAHGVTKSAAVVHIVISLC